MTDYHVHVGQYEKAYYYADRVFSALKANGVDEVYFSSTTSCLRCAPKDLYDGVKGEMNDALKAADEIGMKAHALYWVVPDVHFSGVSVGRAMGETAYDGLKIHPRAQRWDLSDGRTDALADEVFSHAETHGKLVLIHCDDDYPPRLFEPFIARHPLALAQLAHCRPTADTLHMLRKYPNVVCDTAMADERAVNELKEQGFSTRIRFGTDFPATHWREMRPDWDPTEAELTAFLRTTALKAKFGIV